MRRPEHFEIDRDCAFFRPAGNVSLQQAVQMLACAIAFAREQEVPKLLAVTTGLTGFAPPNTLERYEFATQFAAIAGGAVRLALVAKPEMIDPQTFGLTVANNRGLISNVFTSEADALAWLQSL